MKTTEIYIRAFNTNTSIRVKRSDYLNLHDSIEHVEKKLGDTAMVIEVRHGNKIIKNDGYKDPEQVFSK